ncbi:MAG: 4Fe-4S dicluster domain-containing protein [Thermodesulfobacteriota bacterium]|nr:4Fe-4S dicluster domain-containing protein [Thermodesulfobacteriota bacterium]
MTLQGEKTFRDVVIESVGEEIFDCYQCYKCSAGCPISFDMDLLPHQIIRSVVFNQKEKALSSKTIWLCASCETCTTRCPNEIDIAKVMDVLRQIQRESGMPAQEPKIPVFHKAFLNSIKKKGRVHELTMIQQYSQESGDLMEKVKTGTWKDDVKLGMKMFFRGKLKLLPPKCTGVKEVQKLFEQAEGHKKR